MKIVSLKKQKIKLSIIRLTLTRQMYNAVIKDSALTVNFYA